MSLYSYVNLKMSTENPRSSLEDCTCSICMSIMIYPVTMPCQHELCKPCFKHNVEESSLFCPLCRLRISTWTRHASRTNTLVNESRWKQIRKLFPERVQRRLDGKDEDTDEQSKCNGLRTSASLIFMTLKVKPNLVTNPNPGLRLKPNP